MTQLYSHAYTLSFEVTNRSPTGELEKLEAVTALLHRITDLVDDGCLLDAINAPFDTYAINMEET